VEVIELWISLIIWNFNKMKNYKSHQYHLFVLIKKNRKQHVVWINVISRDDNIVAWKLVVGKPSATLIIMPEQKRTQQTQHQ
jgi:hypothetical protein